jgi:hypothetical protein
MKKIIVIKGKIVYKKIKYIKILHRIIFIQNKICNLLKIMRLYKGKSTHKIK